MKTSSIEENALERFAEMLITKIEAFKGDWKKPWFGNGLSYPTNISGREYNGMNAFMLLALCEANGYKYPVFATFDRITSLNYEKGKQGRSYRVIDETDESLPYVCVNKGEKSFPVFLTTFNVVNANTKERIKYDDYKVMSEEQRNDYKVYPSFAVYKVFNVIGQTNIKEARPDLYEKIVNSRSVSAPAPAEADFCFTPLDRMID